MLLYPIAMTPGVLGDEPDPRYWREIEDVFSEAERNCLLCSLADGKLDLELRDRLNSLSNEYADDIRRYHSRFADRNRIVRIPASRPGVNPVTDGQWIDEALALPGHNRLFALFVRECCLRESKVDDASCIAVECAHRAERWENREAASNLVDRCVTDVMPLVAPVLRYSERVWVIDYLLGKNGIDPDTSPWVSTLNQLLRFWSANRMDRFEFVIHTLWPRRYKSGRPVLQDGAELGGCLDRWRAALRDKKILADDDSRVVLKLYEREKYFPKDRFLTTEMAGLQIGKGFDLSDRNRGKTTTLSLLNEATTRNVENGLDPYGNANPREFTLRSL